MLTLRRADTDEDYAHARRIRQVVMPYERADTVEQMRAADRPTRLLLLAERDGEVVGSGLADTSWLRGAAVLAPRVLPEHRRQGIGTEILGALAAHAATLDQDFLIGHADDDGSKAFAENFGFVEVDRQVEQVRPIGAEPRPDEPDGYEIVTVAEHPELWAVAYERIASQAFQDMALISPVNASAEEWERDWIGDPASMFVALAGGEVIGIAGLIADDDDPGRAENALTAVRREWRGKGVAATLKRATLAWAAEHGLREVYTWTQKGNADMRRLNEHLGYVTRLQSYTMRAELPFTI